MMVHSKIHTPGLAPKWRARLADLCAAASDVKAIFVFLGENIPLIAQYAFDIVQTESFTSIRPFVILYNDDVITISPHQSNVYAAAKRIANVRPIKRNLPIIKRTLLLNGQTHTHTHTHSNGDCTSVATPC